MSLSPKALRRVGAAGMVVVVYLSAAIASGAAAGPTRLVPARYGGYPGWLRGPLSALAADTFSSRAFRERGLVQPQAAQSLLEDHLHRNIDRSEALWQVLCLELWAQRFLDRATGQEH